MSDRKKIKFLDEFMDAFRKNRARAYAYIYNKNFIYHVMYEIITGMLAKNKDTKIVFVFNTYDDINRYKFELDREIPDGVSYRPNIKFLSAGYIYEKFHYDYIIAVTVGVNNDLNVLRKMTRSCPFVLHILTAISNNTDISDYLMGNLSLIDTNDITRSHISNLGNVTEINSMYFPVEEWHIPISLNDDTRAEYDKCCDIINNVIRAFSTIDNVTYGLYGDKRKNMSASEYCYNVAINNGWNPNLDTTIEYQRDIDDQYNPIVIHEKARNFFNVTALRKKIVTDAEDKLDKILELCRKHSDKKIVIVNNRGEFATAVAEHLRDNGISCGEYHNEIPSSSVVDENGKVLTYQSGARKGQTKTLGARALSSLYERRFDQGLDNCLSIKNKSANKLSGRFDIVIFTSSFCDDFPSWYARFPNLIALERKVLCYRLYIDNSIEAKAIESMKHSDMVTIMREKENIAYDKNTGDVVLDI